MSSRANNNWNYTPHTPLVTNNLSGPEFMFSTPRWDEERRIDVTSTPTPSSLPSVPSYPSYDLSTLDFDTSRLDPDFDASRLDPVPFGSPFGLVDNEFPPSPFEPFHFATPHFQAASERFDAANEHADIILAIGQDRARASTKARPLAGSGGAANLPQGPLPSLHARVPATDDVRKAIGKSGAAKPKPKPKPKRGRRDEGEQEDVESDDENDPNRTVYTADRLVTLASTAVDLKPFLAPHRSKGATWQALVDKLKADDEVFRNSTISAASVQHKVETLVAFKKNKNPKKYRQLANIIGKGAGVRVTIGALLERLEQDYDEAKGKSDEAKAKIKKKNDEDRDGGEAIRQASMKTLGKRKRQPTPDSDADDGALSDNGSATNTRTPRPTAASSSIETIDSGDDDAANASKGQRKRRRNDRSSETTELFAFMKAENDRRAKHDERIAQSLDRFVGNCAQQKDEYISLLRDLIAKNDA
ncbi:hypothetical protein DFH06DRAFT_1234511 [Mycena polygramma]|nr:hypothetical protein DFH06DRAFT_1234511 [Mycena polygramma]